MQSVASTDAKLGTPMSPVPKVQFPSKVVASSPDSDGGFGITPPSSPSSDTSECPYGNTNPEPQHELSPDGATRKEWAHWRRCPTYEKEISAKRAAYLYALVTFVQAELEKLDIRAYAEGGSLLGQARDGGIIRYDDDIDLQVHYEDKRRFLAAVPILTERVRAWGRAIGEGADLIWRTYGYMAVLIPSDPEMQVLRKPHSMANKEFWIPEDVVVDLFLTDAAVDSSGTARVVYADPTFRGFIEKRGDGDIKVSQLGSLPRLPFGPTMIRVPEFARDAAKEVFGPSCFDKVVCKDGRSGDHHGSLAVPMDDDAMAFFHWLVAVTRDI